MLPPAPKDVGRLSDVFISALGAIIGGEHNRLKLPRVQSALVVLIDGLGYQNLKEHLGHARNLARLLNLSGDQAIRVGFPSTTAVSLTSFGTGLRAGAHGIIGYQALDASDAIRNMLSGWRVGEEPRNWQSNQTVAELASANNVKTFMVASPEYDGSGFTQVFMGGSNFIGVADAVARAKRASGVAADAKTLTYLYFAELDQAAHRFGVASSQWLAALEQIDSAIEQLSGNYGLLVTGDHGVIDVPSANHIFLDDLPGYTEAVRFSIGDPRALYCYGDKDAAAETLKSAGVDAVLTTFTELIAAGWVAGQITIDQVPDFVLIAKGQSAFYDRRTAKPQSLKMVGQHGGLDDRETRVPLIRACRFI